MSRTYRFRKDKWIEKDGILSDRDWDWRRRIVTIVNIDPKSKEGKKRLAKLHSDKKYYFYNSKGPNWFYNMYCQRPYRRDCKEQLRRAMYDDGYEVQIRNKPYREYWD